MSKTLEEAIGCWTVNKDYNSLQVLATNISKTAARCRRITQQNKPPAVLKTELELLQRQIVTIEETTEEAIIRCNVIIVTKELA